jgi:hypothetical protein
MPPGWSRAAKAAVSGFRMRPFSAMPSFSHMRRKRM